MKQFLDIEPLARQVSIRNLCTIGIVACKANDLVIIECKLSLKDTSSQKSAFTQINDFEKYITSYPLDFADSLRASHGIKGLYWKTIRKIVFCYEDFSIDIKQMILKYMHYIFLR